MSRLSFAQKSNPLNTTRVWNSGIFEPVRAFIAPAKLDGAMESLKRQNRLTVIRGATTITSRTSWSPPARRISCKSGCRVNRGVTLSE